MRNVRLRGVITVFFSLLSVVFISLSFAVIESVRVSGARARCRNITVLGNWSVFSEYEKQLLTDYEVFAVDASYGSGDFAIGHMTDRLKGYLEENTAEPEGIPGFTFEPWKVTLTSDTVTKYALLSDKGGEPFYQQAVGYMRQTAALQAVARLLEDRETADELSEAQEAHTKAKKESDSASKSAEEQRRQIENDRLAAKEKEREETGSVTPDSYQVWDPDEQRWKNGNTAGASWVVQNPLNALARVLSRSLTETVCGSLTIPRTEVAASSLASQRAKQSGTMGVRAEYGGVTDDLLFRQYLIDHFPNFTDRRILSTLSFQVEYILGGKRTDEKNLQAVIKKLLAMRESQNYLFCSTDVKMRRQALTMARLLVGWTGRPAIITATQHALLLGWASAESLVDVRILMHGGKVPLVKDASTWRVSLSDILHLGSILDGINSAQGENGLTYRAYLQILLSLQSVTTQKKRALDLVELNISSMDGLTNFRVDNCVVAIEDETEWTIPAHFSNVTRAFLGVSSDAHTLKVESSFAC